MYAVVNNIIGHGITVVYNRSSLAEANKVAVRLAVEQGFDEGPNEADDAKRAAYEAEAMDAFQKNGNYDRGSEWEITVIKVEDSPKPLIAPLTLAEARQRLDENDELVVVVAVGLEDIGSHGDVALEDFNDFIEGYVAEQHAFTLSRIRYRVVGHIPGMVGGPFVSGSVLIEVRAEIEAQDDDGEGDDDEYCISIEGSGDLVKDGFASEAEAYQWLDAQLEKGGTLEGCNRDDYIVEQSDGDDD